MSVSLWSTVLVAAVLVAVVGGAAGGVVLAEVRAQDAADAAALAATHAQRRGTDPAGAGPSSGRRTTTTCERSLRPSVVGRATERHVAGAAA